MSKAKVDQHLRPYTLGLIEFAEAVVAGTEESDTGLRRTVAALLGDVASSVSGVGALFQQKPFARQFLQYCTQVPEIADTARWALQMVSAAETAGANSMPVLRAA
jgi:importin subunit beta-1